MIAEGYSMHLYCDNCWNKPPYRKFPYKYFGETRSEVHRMARIDGWLIGRERQLCPDCSGKRKDK